MKKHILIIVGLFLINPMFSYNLLSQNQNPININSSGDCVKAMYIKLDGIFGPTTTLEGFGEKLEFSNNPKNSLLYIEKEHNTVWYKFEMTENADLTFEIIPMQKTDDYDFMLFQYTDSNFCENIISKKIEPIRTNISRCDTSIEGKTGLSFNSENEYTHSGLGWSYSKPIRVHKGDRFYILIDNVYENGLGHQIKFKYYRAYEINGKTIDKKTNKPIKATILWEDLNTGETLASTKSDPLTGEYLLKAPIDYKLNDIKYNLSIVGDTNYFFSDTIIEGKSLAKKGKLSFIGKLEQLIKGNSYLIKNINFHSNSDKFLPGAEPSLKKLYKLLKHNKKMKILIEGHTNGVGMNNFAFTKQEHQTLSDMRANAVYNYLINNDINPDRLQTKGFGCTRMLYPNAKNEYQAMLNRRVEIKILEY